MSRIKANNKKLKNLSLLKSLICSLRRSCTRQIFLSYLNFSRELI